MLKSIVNREKLILSENMNKALAGLDQFAKS